MDEKEIREIFGIKPERTLKQNKAMHLYFTLLSEAFNEAGLDLKDVLNEIRCSIPATPISVKEALWKPLMKLLTGKERTRDMDTTDITKVYEPLNLALGERLGIHVPFPDEKTTEAYLKSLKQTKK